MRVVPKSSGDVNVLHIVATLQRRGAEIFACDLASALNEMGVRQEVGVLRPSRGVIVDCPVPWVLVRDSESRRLLPGDVYGAAGLRRLVRDRRPAVIQAHGGEAMKVAALSNTKVPIIYRKVGGAPVAMQGGWRRLAHQRLAARAHRIVAVADAVRTESIELLKISPARILTIPNAVDPGRLDASIGRRAMRRRFQIDAEANLIVSVGALSWEKDPMTLIRVGASVLERLPGAVHVFLGDGPIRARAEKEASAIGFGDRMLFAGNRGDATALLASADVLLFASRPDGMEGMPAVLIEAGMQGVPVVAYEVAGVGEVVLDGLTGRLVPWGDEEGLSQALLEVLQVDGVRTAMGEAARVRCLEQFSIQRIAPRYLDLYREVAAA